MSEWIDVVKEEAFMPGTWETVDVDDILIAVFNLNGEFYAIEDICTHDGGTLTGGGIEGKEIICPRHGARFDITTGEVLADPAYEDLPTFSVRVKDGMVQVELCY
ncbi:MAG: non-heme iron oxygenase ferredoxin subunit [Gammaproteobacteria bacterium]|nr:non-heme iron oxygenase ferredoxin subunit [Gammaproteobacteria bacterium]